MGDREPWQWPEPGEDWQGGVALDVDRAKGVLVEVFPGVAHRVFPTERPTILTFTGETGEDPIEPDPEWAADMGEIQGYLHPTIGPCDPRALPGCTAPRAP